MSFETLLINTVTIQSNVYPTGGTGNMTVTYTSLYTGIKCRIEPSSASVGKSVIGRFPNATHRIFCDSSIIIKEGYKVIDENNIEYIVVGVESFSNFSKHHTECMLERSIL